MLTAGIEMFLNQANQYTEEKELLAILSDLVLV